jgi:hypothetical protein
MITLAEDLEGNDLVNKPKHYMLFSPNDVINALGVYNGIEVRDVISRLLEKLELSGEYDFQFASDYAQCMQYLMRFMDKGSGMDLRKARWYLDKMIEAE